MFAVKIDKTIFIKNYTILRQSSKQFMNRHWQTIVKSSLRENMVEVNNLKRKAKVANFKQPKGY